MSNHIVNHINFPNLKGDDTLHVVAVISNPVRYHSRYRLAREFIEAMSNTKGVRLHVVESSFGDRHHEVTDSCNPDHMQVRTKSEIWNKENLINLGMRSVLVRCPTAKYLAWIDADVFFCDPHWALETCHQLQHFAVVQPWADCLDLGHSGGVLSHFKSFGAQHQRRVKKQTSRCPQYQYAHTGFAWACTRAFWEATGGLMEFPILGSSDSHMAWAMIGDVVSTIPKVSESYKRLCLEWQTRALRITKHEVGFVRGRIEHKFHGPKKRRYYKERWQILLDHHFDPDKDLMHNEHGVLTLIGKPALEQAIRLYNRSRFEDSIEET